MQERLINMHASMSWNRWGKQILEIRIGGENVTAHRQMKTHREALISAGDEEKKKKKKKIIQKPT